MISGIYHSLVILQVKPLAPHIFKGQFMYIVVRSGRWVDPLPPVCK